MRIFKNIEEAIVQLSEHALYFQFPLRKELKSTKDIINYSVGQNIFRALGCDNYKPSEVYRSWTTKNFVSLHHNLFNCQNQNDFDWIIKSFSEGLLIYWRTATNNKLIYGPASKIVNLLIKTIQESEKFQIKTIVPFQHVPWDSFSLRPLRNIINELTCTNYRINIPPSASMSFVNSIELYDTLQKAVFKLYDMIEGKPPTIYFDYFAWNDNHSTPH
jgi:hypothetical protein